MWDCWWERLEDCHFEAAGGRSPSSSLSGWEGPPGVLHWLLLSPARVLPQPRPGLEATLSCLRWSPCPQTRLTVTSMQTNDSPIQHHPPCPCSSCVFKSRIKQNQIITGIKNISRRSDKDSHFFFPLASPTGHSRNQTRGFVKSGKDFEVIPCHPAFVISVDLPTETRDVE